MAIAVPRGPLSPGPRPCAVGRASAARASPASGGARSPAARRAVPSVPAAEWRRRSGAAPQQWSRLNLLGAEHDLVFVTVCPAEGAVHARSLDAVRGRDCPRTALRIGRIVSVQIEGDTPP